MIDRPENIAIVGSLAETIFACHTLSLVARFPVANALSREITRPLKGGGGRGASGAGEGEEGRTIPPLARTIF